MDWSSHKIQGIRYKVCVCNHGKLDTNACINCILYMSVMGHANL